MAANKWASRKIKQGYITETLLGFKKEKPHDPHYEYHYFPNKVLAPSTASAEKQEISPAVINEQPAVEKTKARNRHSFESRYSWARVLINTQHQFYSQQGELR